MRNSSYTIVAHWEREGGESIENPQKYAQDLDEVQVPPVHVAEHCEVLEKNCHKTQKSLCV